MFTRVEVCQAKSGRAEAVGDTVKDDLLPIMRKQLGFVDLVLLADKENPERLICLSFWATREEAEVYHSHYHNGITDMLMPILKSPPTLETFSVIASTAHRIAVAVAA
jgi:heme-degrading monooxygenase HmoA